MTFYRCYRSLHTQGRLADQLAFYAQTQGGWFTVNPSGLYLYVTDSVLTWLLLLDSQLEAVPSLDYVM